MIPPNTDTTATAYAVEEQPGFEASLLLNIGDPSKFWLISTVTQVGVDRVKIISMRAKYFIILSLSALY
jgi:hypothetical protein